MVNPLLVMLPAVALMMFGTVEMGLTTTTGVDANSEENVTSRVVTSPGVGSMFSLPVSMWDTEDYEPMTRAVHRAVRFPTSVVVSLRIQTASELPAFQNWDSVT